MDQIKKEAIAVGAIFAVGWFGGGGLAWYLTKRHYTMKYEQIIAEEVYEAREFYKRTYKAEEFETPEAAAEVLLEDAAEAMRSYQGDDESPEAAMAYHEAKGRMAYHTSKDDGEVESEVEVQIVERNIFDNGDELKINKDDRHPGKPYVVDLDEYMDVPEGHDQVTLTYYSGDNVLADESDEVVHNVDTIVGRMNLNMFGASDPDQPHVVLVRNPKLKMDYEITYSTGKYAHEVMGIQHSDEPRRRQRPQWDDEEG
jgi:hypothetical protein